MTLPSIELTGIYIYPVKSLRGVSLEAAALENGRLVGDRTWLVVDFAGRFMHMRDYPQWRAWKRRLRIAASSRNKRLAGLELTSTFSTTDAVTHGDCGVAVLPLSQ